MTGDVMMKKVNRIRLYFILGTVFGIAGYFAGYRYVTGKFPEEITVMPETATEPETDQGRGAEEPDTEPVAESALIQKSYEYVIVAEDGYLSVYRADQKTKYMDTDISVKELNDDIKEEIRHGKKFENAEELYGFLENYSS
jgi:hypothetical protein